MTINEAKELYLKSDCSYFNMCTYYYSGYIEYKQLGIPKSKEREWKIEKLQMLCREMNCSGDYRIFIRLCDIAVAFRTYEKLRMVLRALSRVKCPLTPTQCVSMAEAIIGKKLPVARSGLIYWAYDNGQRGIAILLMDQALQYLDIPHTEDIELEQRIQKAKRVCKKINTELRLHFSEVELRDYSARKF